MKPDVAADGKRALALARTHSSGDSSDATSWAGISEPMEFMLRVRGSSAGRAPSLAGSPTARAAAASGAQIDSISGDPGVSPLLGASSSASAGTQQQESEQDASSLVGAPASDPPRTVWAFDRPLFLRADGDKRRALWLQALELHGAKCAGVSLLLVAAGLQAPQSLLEEVRSVTSAGVAGPGGLRIAASKSGELRSVACSLDGSESEPEMDDQGRGVGAAAAGGAGAAGDDDSMPALPGPALGRRGTPESKSIYGSESKTDLHATTAVLESRVTSAPPKSP